ncbi:AAA domain containing protein [Desulfovibrio sp. X2]|uniref:AAA family ATPase n=1 Tax=Desulfovibrio sp. X2 TaxID=941449 RepID=UPI000358F12B|nr:P-loop NTPase [Desulfovibrio sp. X2]EPR44146.1 AAA domain containing protein [Desulfovibrio sp. X2]
MSNAIPLTLAVRTPGLRERLAEILAANANYALLEQDAPAEGSLLVFEPGDEPGEDLARLGRALARGVVRDIFMVTLEKDPAFLVEAVRAGVREILLLPLREGEFEQALQRYTAGQRQMAGTVGDGRLSDGRGRVVAVMGVKHGMGATTLAVNLAVAMSGHGGTALLDMVRPGPEIPFFLDVEYAWSWAEAARDPARCDTAFFQGLLAEHSSGVRLLPGPNEASEQDLLTAETAEMLLDRACEVADSVVVDLPPVLDDAALAVLRKADEIVLVMNLTLPCLAAARSMLEGIRAEDEALGERVRLVGNRWLKDQEIGPADVQGLLQKPVTRLVPDDAAACMQAVNRGKPLVDVAPKSGVAKAMRHLAAELGPVPVAAPKSARKGLLPRVLGVIRRSGGQTGGQTVDRKNSAPQPV